MIGIAIDPSSAPAVAAPELGGFNTREVIELLREICISSDVIGVDFVEFNPLLDDRAGTTALLVSRLIRETLGGIALRKKGIRDPF